MNKLVHQLQQHVQNALGMAVQPRPWSKSSMLPQYLRGRYRYFIAEMLGTDCMLMADIGEDEQTPAVIGKHMSQIRSRSDAEVVYVRAAITPHNRKRLIEQKVPFIIPGNQMYLPILGIDLREHFKRLREKKPIFSPSTQAFMIFVMLREKGGTMTPAETARRLGYSAMTLTRAFDELESAGIGEHSVRGKERHVRFTESGKALWERVLPHLNTPVKKRLNAATQPPDGHLAGPSALSRYTMLSEPETRVFAIGPHVPKTRMQQDYFPREVANREPHSIEIEVWKYPPGLFAEEGTVDRLSLYLSLNGSKDERVQSALDELLKGMRW